MTWKNWHQIHITLWSGFFTFGMLQSRERVAVVDVSGWLRRKETTLWRISQNFVRFKRKNISVTTLLLFTCLHCSNYQYGNCHLDTKLKWVQFYRVVCILFSLRGRRLSVNVSVENWTDCQRKMFERAIILHFLKKSYQMTTITSSPVRATQLRYDKYLPILSYFRLRPKFLKCIKKESFQNAPESNGFVYRPFLFRCSENRK